MKPMNEVLEFSAGTVDITPSRPLTLGGYDKRTGPATGIADRLEANVLLVRGQSSRVVIVSTDLLYPGAMLRAELLNAMGPSAAQEELFLCASHTHYAPMTAGAMPRLGTVDRDYVRSVAARIGALIKSLEGKRASGLVTYHEGQANHSMNRRLCCLRLGLKGLSRAVGMGPNRQGKRDENVRVLKFCAAEGRPLALVWNYACHASDAVDRWKVSAAYPGFVRAHLRALLGPIPILFLQGFSGNVRPPFVGISDGFRGVARRLLRGPQFKKTPQPGEWEIWSNSLAASVAAIARSSPRQLRARSPAPARSDVPEPAFASDGNGDKSLTWHLIDCGGFRIVGINAEPVVEYRQLVAELLAGTPFLSAGCLDQTHCYLPTDEMVREGGYEVEGFRALLDFKGRFRDRPQGPVIEGLRQALEACARSRAGSELALGDSRCNESSQ
jgi:hypothetical protein